MGKERGGEKAKSKSQDCLVTWEPNFAFCACPNFPHLDQNAAKCTTCKWLYGTFYFFTARHGDQGTSRLPSKRVSAKFPGVNGLKVAGFENLKERLNSVEKFLVTVLYYILANFIFEMTVFPSLSPFQGLFCVSVLSQYGLIHWELITSCACLML